MPPHLTPYQKHKHREALDEIYLEKQLVFLTQQKSEILFAIREYRKKHFTSYHNHFVSIEVASRLLNTSKRTIRLLAVHKYISSFFFSSYSLFNLTEIRDFIKSLAQVRFDHYSKVNK